ncbi:MAG: ATP-binding protein [Flavobacteriaceae bacterium]|nr:ATP-binding protein [Flavobacteriaceae bacterium]
MIHLIVGNTGSGKTTYSNALKKDFNGIVFSIDTWNNTLFIQDKTDNDGLDWSLERIERAESLILNLVLQLNSVNIDSILDLGLSKFGHREKFRKFAKKNAIELKLHFLDIPKETRRQRILERNRTKGITYEFDVTKENFEFMEGWFEKPTNSELKNAIIIT